MADVKVAHRRPISPHLGIYRLTITMAMSIVHRITGGALYFGAGLFAIWLLSAASGPAAFDRVQDFFGSIIGRLILFGYTWVLMHHALGGLRHLIWDTIHGLEAPWRDYLAWGTLIGSAVLTVLIWIITYATW